MNVEVHVSNKALAVRFNGVFSPTDRGHLAHELARINSALKKNANPKVAFAMSEKLAEQYKERRDELCDQLGLPQDEKIREKAIQGYSGYLASVGLPYYKINLNKK